MTKTATNPDNDRCDYCHQYVDAIGNDGLSRFTIPPLFWCGACPEGLKAIYDPLTDDQLQRIIGAYDDAVKRYGTPHEFSSAIESNKDKYTETALMSLHRTFWGLLRASEDAMNAKTVLGWRKS